MPRPWPCPRALLMGDYRAIILQPRFRSQSLGSPLIVSAVAKDQGPVSQKPRKPRRARKAIAKCRTLRIQSCFIYIFLIWEEVHFIQEGSGVYTSPLFYTYGLKMALRARNVSGAFERPGYLKPDYANPGLARILILSLKLFSREFCVNIFVLQFWAWVLSNYTKHKTQAMDDTFMQKKMSRRLTFDTGLPLTGFRTTRPCWSNVLLDRLFQVVYSCTGSEVNQSMWLSF